MLRSHFKKETLRRITEHQVRLFTHRHHHFSLRGRMRKREAFPIHAGHFSTF